ncbi:MAG: exodeoxyribonuclease VII large subunit [Candidatus Eisenbacteria bacterium]|nr:exodeoxyribonuclease VII large subunit [Candidatus Eisenbacteria bacterium]
MEASPRTFPAGPYSVAEITRLVREVLEGAIPVVWVKGEVSNFTLHTSGHMYFSLKDETAQLRCVMFRSANSKLSFGVENGMSVEARGEITVYERSGQYQLCVFEMIPAGLGSLQLALEQLKKKLSKEGLFDEARKRPLPPYPTRVGVVTSPTGAAVRDIVRIIRKRQPAVEIILRPVRVQGEGAAQEIALAVEEFNRFGDVDVLIVGRGGGSLEDLWAFNAEVVARAIFASRIPVVSAVGHEIDFTVSDLVADVRAPTPSGAAQMVVRDRSDVAREVLGLARGLASGVRNKVSSLRREIERTRSRYAFARAPDIVRQRVQRLDEVSRRLQTSGSRIATERRQLLDSQAGRLRALDPAEVLRRGYAVCRREATGEVLREASASLVRQRVRVELYRGSLRCNVEGVSENEGLA